jgi:predicted ArsR family transcriptional regulator
MTHERLETLRYIGQWRVVTADGVASALGISYNTAVRRLERMRDMGLVRSDTNFVMQKEFGPVHLDWSLTRNGRKRLEYFEQHLREVA